MPSRTSTGRRSCPVKPTPTSCTTCRRTLTAPRSIHPNRSTSSWSSIWAGRSATGLDPILDMCVAAYMRDLDEDRQVDFKGKAKGFVRTYAFLSCVLPYTNAAWEKRSIFLNFLIAKLPAPKEEDLSRGILDAIDMDSYRVEKRAMQKILLPDEDAEIEPVADQRRRPPRTNRNWTGSRTSSRPSTTCSEISSGKMPTASGKWSRRPFPTGSPPTTPSGTPSKTRTGRMPESSTTRRCSA